jgi:nitroimidazol reductase NimA-like FMN-containing flavoprotein (pyridoxamine 5'-phosphate oxidase superfamily)
MIRELTTPECHDVLRRATIARLGCARENQPYVVPVHVYFDGDCLYSFAMLGQKIAWMRENPRSAFRSTTSSIDFTGRPLSLSGNTRAASHARHEDDRRRAEAVSGVPEWWQPAHSNPGREVRMAMIYRIRIDRVTGRLAERSTDETTKRPWWLELLLEPTDPDRQNI